MERNRLSNIGGDGYRGKFTGGNHRVTYDNIRHALNQHGDVVREALRAQLPLTAEDVARTISAVKNGRSKIQNTATRTKEGKPSLLHAVEVNGYTLYAEEIAMPKQKGGIQDLLGKTMYKEPTMPTASGLVKKTKVLPKRQGEALYEYNTPNGTTLSRGFVADANGDAAVLYYDTIDGKPVSKRLYGGLIFLSADQTVVTNHGEHSGNVQSGYVYMTRPYVITRDNPVFVESSARVSELVRKLKDQGYDGFIFDYKVGDNYAVMIFNESQIVSDLSGYTKKDENLLSDRETEKKMTQEQEKFSMREPVEYTKNLVALHNLTEDKLAKTLDLGGFPMPSIAITKADIPHTNFGDITLVFGRETVDPKVNKKNMVYSADAWTPIFPRTEYEENQDVGNKVHALSRGYVNAGTQLCSEMTLDQLE